MADKPTYEELKQRVQELEKGAFERKRAEEALRATHRKLRAVFDAIQDNINVVDLDFNLTDVNEGLMKAFGLSDKERVLDRKCFSVLKGRKEICPRCAVAEVYRTKAPAYRTSTPEDEVSTGGRNFELFAYPIMDGDGNLTGAVQFAGDVSERKRAEETLRKARDELELRVEQRTAELVKANEELRQEMNQRKRTEETLYQSELWLRNIFNSLEESVFVLTPNRELVNVNDAAERMFGYSLEELRGCSTEVLHVDHEHYLEFGRWIKEAFEQGKTAKFEFEAKRKNGEIFPTGHTVSLLRNDQGESLGIVSIVRDITERRQAEHALREAREQLMRQEKLAVLGQLAGGVGHELRNPLGAIRNAVYFLNMALEEPEPGVKDALAILNKEIATSERIIASLLDFSRAKPPAQLKVDINDVVQAALSGRPVPDNVEVVSQLGETLPAISADPDQLSQVFGNLILNAIQAMPEGGRVQIKSEVSKPNWVTISVSDTGTGISDEQIDKVFEPLFTTKAKGIGLGLALTRTHVEAHGGTIEVESEVGKGSTFTVKLPVG